MKTYSETRKAFDLLVRAEILSVNGVLINGNDGGWRLGGRDVGGFFLQAENAAEFFNLHDNDETFSCSYTDEKGYIFQFSFSKKSLVEAAVDENLITITDDGGQTVDIACFELKALDNGAHAHKRLGPLA